MSKELVRASQNYLAHSSDTSLRQDTSSALLTVGGGGLVLYGVAALPFISMLPLLLVVLVLGGYLKFKS